MDDGLFYDGMCFFSCRFQQLSGAGGETAETESKGDAVGECQREGGAIKRSQHAWVVLVSVVCEPEGFYLYEEKLENQCGAPRSVHQRL